MIRRPLTIQISLGITYMLHALELLVDIVQLISVVVDLVIHRAG